MIGYKWFAWYPVRTEDAGWVWLTTVLVMEDDTDMEYLGLDTKYMYFKDKLK